VQTAARGAVCVFYRLRLKFPEKVLRAFLQIAQLHRRGEEVTKQFLHARVGYRITIHGFVVQNGFLCEFGLVFCVLVSS